MLNNMKTIKSLLGVLAAMFLFAACDLLNPEAGGLHLDREELQFTSEAGSKTFSITSPEDWEVIVTENWLSVTPDEGFSSESPQTLTVTVVKNTTGAERSADITIKAGTICGTVVVTQLPEGANPGGGEGGSGDGGEGGNGDGNEGGDGDGNEGGSGDGNEGGDNTGSDQAVTTIADLKKDFVTAGGNYEIQFTDAVVTYVNGPNAFIEDATGGILLYCTNHGLAAGDCLNGLASGQYSIFRGLPELTSMSGATKTSGATIPCKTLTLARLLADYDRYVSCRIKIEDVTIADAVSGKGSTTLSQGGSSEKLYVQRSEVSIEAGTGDIIVYPSYYNSRQLGLWEQNDFVKDSTTPTPDPDPDPDPEPGVTGGTADDPYTVAEAVAAASATARDGVYVTGYISHKKYGTPDTGGCMTYYISDDGTRSNELYIYKGYYLNGERFSSGDQIAVGDRVTIVGKLFVYNGTTKELDAYNRMVSHTPQQTTPDPDPEPEPEPDGGLDTEDFGGTGDKVEW